MEETAYLRGKRFETAANLMNNILRFWQMKIQTGWNTNAQQSPCLADP